MNKIQFMHYRPKDKNQSRGGATIAICPTEGNKVRVSIALCGDKDVFSKKLGRQISAGRMTASINGTRDFSKSNGTSVQRRTILVSTIREIEVDDLLNMKQTVAKQMAPVMAEYDLV